MDSGVNAGARSDDSLLLEIHQQVRTIAGRLMSSDRADDVTQDVLVDCLESMRAGTWQVAPDALEAYLVCMVLRRRADERRRERRATRRGERFMREITASTHTWMHQEAKLEERELTVLYEGTLAALGPMCRRAFVLVRETGLSYAEAAEELGVSKKAVAAQITRALRVFRDVLEERGIVVPEEKPSKGGGRAGSGEEEGPANGEAVAASEGPTARKAPTAREQAMADGLRRAANYFRAELDRREAEERRQQHFTETRAPDASAPSRRGS